jgi:hypothetical protein
MRLFELLRHLTDDLRACRVGELLELTQMLVDDALGAGPFERCADEDRSIDRGRDGYWVFGNWTKG